MTYLDASVVVAYYLEETYSERVQEMYRSHTELFCSELTEVEAFSVISRLVRVQSFPRDTGRQVAAMFTEHLEAGLYARLHLRSDHYRWAREAISRFDLPLKAPDALHLAVAGVDRLQLVTADRQLARNAEVLDVPHELISS